MTMNPCRRAFEVAQKNRRKHPLTRGDYKLRDTQRNLGRMITTSDTIGDHLRHPPKHRAPVALGGCTTDDKAVYLKRLPTAVATMFGHDVLPAIAALTDDGVPLNDVRQALGRIQRRVDHLLDKCDVQHARLKGGIATEYADMKAGYSELYGLLTDAMDIVRDAQAVQEFHERREKYRPQSGLDCFSV